MPQQCYFGKGQGLQFSHWQHKCKSSIRTPILKGYLNIHSRGREHLNCMVSSACWEMIISAVTEGKVLQGELRLSQKDSSEIEMTELFIMFM